MSGSFGPHGGLGSERLAEVVFALHVRATQEVDAVRHGRKYAMNQGGALCVFQATQGFFDGLGLSG